MLKIESSPNNNILINGNPYAVNSVFIEPSKDKSRITFRVSGQRDKIIANNIAFGSIVDDTDTPFADWDAFVTYVDGFFFRKPGLAPGQVALDGAVDFFSSLPPAASHTDERWIVDNKEGTWLLGTLKRSGVYKSNGTVWNKLSTVQDLLLDDEFNIKDESDNTKAMRFELAGITTGNTRTLTPQDKDYVIADNADVTQNATDLSNHVGDTNNPHGTDIGNIGIGTLAELNAAVTDATLDDAGDSRTPTNHASTHEESGSDEIQGANLLTTFSPDNYTPTDTDLAGQLDGIDNALASSGVQFPKIIAKVEDRTTIVTFSTSGQVYMNLAASGLDPGGTFKVSGFYLWSHDATNNDFFMEVRNFTNLIPTDRHQQEPADSGGGGVGGTNQRVPANFEYEVTPVLNAVAIDFNFGTTSPGSESTLFMAYAELVQTS